MQFSLQALSLLVVSLAGITSAAPAAAPVAAPAAAPAVLEARQSLPTTENGLSGACKAITVVFARGTNEAGNVGSIAGPPWFSALRTGLGTAALSVQGVTYTADVGGYLSGGSASGSTEMLRLINLASTNCPSTKIVLGGYSQGAQLVHNAAAKLTAAVTAKIAAVVVFGDPFRGTAVGTVPTAKVLSICHNQDIICTGSGGFTTHLTYNVDNQTAANFVIARV